MALYIYGDYLLRKATLETGEAEQEHVIEHGLGREFEPTDALLPPLRKEWPALWRVFVGCVHPWPSWGV